MNFPFTEKIISEGVVERTFAKDINRDDLVWHRDRDDRHLVVVESVGWQFQMDNQLPINLEPGQELLIPAGSWHRVIKGNSPLRVIINKAAKIKESKMRITKSQLKQIIMEELTEGEARKYNFMVTHIKTGDTSQVHAENGNEAKRQARNGELEKHGGPEGDYKVMKLTVNESSEISESFKKGDMVQLKSKLQRTFVGAFDFLRGQTEYANKPIVGVVTNIQTGAKGTYLDAETIPRSPEDMADAVVATVMYDDGRKEVNFFASDLIEPEEIDAAANNGSKEKPHKLRVNSGGQVIVMQDAFNSGSPGSLYFSTVGDDGQSYEHLQGPYSHLKGTKEVVWISEEERIGGQS